jgi:ribosomal protein L3 glutamine methyltransferase
MPEAHAALGEWIARAATRLARARLFFGHGTSNAGDEAAWLAVHVARLRFEDLAHSLDRTLSAAELRRAEQLLEQRITTRKPLAYLLKEAWLRDRRFYVDERVIVPRSFIAELLPDGLKPWIARPGAVKRVLDMCTGSGCLAIIAAQSYPSAEVVAVDISAAALAVARRNVAEYGLESRIRLVKSDLFASLETEPFDLILSNPPYVAAADMRRLPAEYRHEPDLALAGGRDGLDAVDVILRDAPRFLAPRGVLFVEIGHNRRTVERRYPGLPLTWPTTSAGDDMCFLLRREQLKPADAGTK